MTPIAHQSDGAGAPVVLLNGGLMTMAMWEPIAAALRPHHQVIRCDFRGQLLSPGEPHATLAGHVADVVGVLDALGVPSAHIVGTSFGGIVAFALAATYGARVRSLVAGTTSAWLTEEYWISAAPLVDACRAAAAGTGDGGRILDLVAPLTYSPGFLAANGPLLAQRRGLLSMLPRQYFDGAAGIVSLLEGLDLRPLLPDIACPTLVLAAECDRTFPLPHARAIAAGIPGARLDILAGAPHGVFVEDASRVIPALTAFLAA
jgi:3-oxoadipate enol-lactonase